MSIGNFSKKTNFSTTGKKFDTTRENELYMFELVNIGMYKFYAIL